MLELMVNFFLSGFVYPGILWHQVLLSIGLALAFGAHPLETLGLGGFGRQRLFNMDGGCLYSASPPAGSR
jgi:hypothetical protein